MNNTLIDVNQFINVREKLVVAMPTIWLLLNTSDVKEISYALFYQWVYVYEKENKDISSFKGINVLIQLWIKFIIV